MKPRPLKISPRYANHKLSSTNLYWLVYSIIIPFHLRQLPGDLLVQNVAHGDGDDDAVLLAEKAVNLAQRVAGIVEANKEPLLALRPAHRRFKGVNVRPARLVLLLHLHGIKALLQRQLIRPGLAHVVQGRDGEDASINALVADLRLVLPAAQRDDRPILQLERGIYTQFRSEEHTSELQSLR